MADVRTLLGEGYEVSRLRSDGYLDGRFEKTWNCVAVPRGTTFHRVCSDLVRGA